jgi:hypothetical protein
MAAADDDKAALLKELGHEPSVWESFTGANKPGEGVSNEDVLKKAYTQFTGREADAPGLAAHLKNPGGLEGGLKAIYGSQESQNFGRKDPNAWAGVATAPTTPATTPPAAGATTPAAGATTPPAVQPSIFQGFTPKYAMEGFDFNREQNTGKSAKDAFAYLSQQAPPPPINDKAALGKWAEQYIVPGMNALGHNVSNVQGDKFHLKNWQGDFDVDYGRGAGAEGGALAWQVDDPTARLSNQAYTPQPSNANAALSAAIGGGQGGGTTAKDAILKEIEALIQGGASPTDNAALLEQLQV